MARFVRVFFDSPKSKDPKDVRERAEQIYRQIKGQDAGSKSYEPFTRPVTTTDSSSTKRADWTMDLRQKLQAGEIDGEFAGPDMSYPITDANDVKDAWKLAGHADSPDEVRGNIIRIARSYGWERGLPKAAEEWEEKRQ